MIRNHREYVHSALNLCTLAAKFSTDSSTHSHLHPTAVIEILSYAERHGLYRDSPQGIGPSSSFPSTVTHHTLQCLTNVASRHPEFHSHLRFLLLCLHMGGGQPYLLVIRSQILQRLVSSSSEETFYNGLDDGKLLTELLAYQGKGSDPIVHEIVQNVESTLLSRRRAQVDRFVLMCEQTILLGHDSEDWSAYNVFFKNRIVTHSVVSFVLYCVEMYEIGTEEAKEAIDFTLALLCDKYMRLRPSMHRAPQVLTDALVLVRSMRAMRCKCVQGQDAVLKKLILYAVVLTSPLQTLVEWVEGECPTEDGAVLCLTLWHPEPWAVTKETSKLDIFRTHLNPTEDDIKRIVAECCPSLGIAYEASKPYVTLSFVLQDIVIRRWELFDSFPPLDEAQEVLVERLRAALGKIKE